MHGKIRRRRVERAVPKRAEQRWQLERRHHALMEAVATGDAGLVLKELDSGWEGQVRRHALRHALVLSARRGHLSVVEMLLRAGARANEAGEDGAKPLHVAAMKKSNAAIVGLLCNAGADANAAMSDGSTALHISAQMGHTDIVSSLLRCGAKNDNLMAGPLKFLLHLTCFLTPPPSLSAFLLRRRHSDAPRCPVRPC